MDGRHYSVENDGHIYTLTISGLARADSGKYTCKISNEFGQDEVGAMAVREGAARWLGADFESEGSQV